MLMMLLVVTIGVIASIWVDVMVRVHMILMRMAEKRCIVNQVQRVNG